MVAKLVTGACVVALAAISGSHAARETEDVAHPVVVRLSVPLPGCAERGRASFVSTFAHRRFSFAAVWSGEEERARLFVALAPELEAAE
jgi:hypothetical protein